MPTSSVVGRIAAVLALIGAAVVLLLLFVGGGSSYTVTAKFENASQLVTGNTVNVAGVAAGSVKEITLADDGQALVKMEVSEEYAPLPAGNPRHRPLPVALGDRQPLRRPRPAPAEAPARRARTIAERSGGSIEQVDTTSEVDLDQLFNTLDEETVDSLKSVIKGFARSYDGVGPQANRGFYYLNPFLSTSRRVFGELNSDQPRARVAARRRRLAHRRARRARPRHRGADREPRPDDGGDRPPRDRARLGDRPAARLHAPVQHHRGQPPRRARRRRPPVTASRPVARKLQPFAAQPARLRPRRGADGQGPRRDRPRPGRRQRPDRAHRAPGAAGGDRGRPGQPQRRLARRAPCRSRRPRSAPTAPTAPAPTTTAASTSSSSSAPTSPRRRSPAGSTTSATPASRTRSGQSAASTRPSTPSPPAILPAAPPLRRHRRRRPLDPIGFGSTLGNAARCPGANVHGSQLSRTETTQLDYQGDPYLQGGALDCDPNQTLPGP